MKLEAGAGPPIDDPTDEQVAEGLSALDTEQGGFVILSRDTQTYLQASGTPDDGFVLEYRDGSREDHYRSRSAEVPLETAVDVFQAYRRGDDAWNDPIEWEEVEVKRDPADGVGCLTVAVLAAGTLGAGMAWLWTAVGVT